MSDNPFFDSRVLSENPLTSTGELLTKFSECSLFTFSAKDIKTRKIVIHNKMCAELYGLTKQGLVGMTSRECLERVEPFTQKEDALKAWEQEETRAITTNSVQTNMITILDVEGFVRIRQHLTIPVCGEDKQIVALAAFCYDRTHRIDLLRLFGIYQKFYSKGQSILKLSQYLKLDKLFQLQLTGGELYTLLALVQAPRHKQAAYILSVFRGKAISPSTIAGYIERIKDKLKPYHHLEYVLNHLRGANQWTSNLDSF